MSSTDVAWDSEVRRLHQGDGIVRYRDRFPADLLRGQLETGRVALRLVRSARPGHGGRQTRGGNCSLRTRLRLSGGTGGGRRRRESLWIRLGLTDRDRPGSRRRRHLCRLGGRGGDVLSGSGRHHHSTVPPRRVHRGASPRLWPRPAPSAAGRAQCGGFLWRGGEGRRAGTPGGGQGGAQGTPPKVSAKSGGLAVSTQEEEPSRDLPSLS